MNVIDRGFRPEHDRVGRVSKELAEPDRAKGGVLAGAVRWRSIRFAVSGLVWKHRERAVSRGRHVQTSSGKGHAQWGNRSTEVAFAWRLVTLRNGSQTVRTITKVPVRLEGRLAPI